MPFLLQLAVAAGVEGDLGSGGLAVPVPVLFQDLRIDGGLAGRAGGFSSLVQREQRVNGLLRPGPVEVRAGLGDRDELPQHVCTTQSVARDVLEGVIRLPRAVDGDAGEERQIPAALIPSLPRLACTVTSTNFPQEAECTQASFPAVRNPVSSKCTTSQLLHSR